MSWFSANIDKQKHCFFGREGGVSEGIYTSLNTNTMSADKKENIRKNLEIIASYFNLNRSEILK